MKNNAAMEDHWSNNPRFEAEQEPVAWYDKQHKDFSHVQRIGWEPLYTTPPQRTWVGLTDDDLEAAMDGMYNRWDIAEAIEAKLKEKNT